MLQENSDIFYVIIPYENLIPSIDIFDKKAIIIEQIEIKAKSLNLKNEITRRKKTLYLHRKKIRMAKTILLLLLLISFKSEGQQVLTKRHRAGFLIEIGKNYNTSNSELLNLQSKFSNLHGFGSVYEYQYTQRLAFRCELNLEFSKATFTDDTTDMFNLFHYSSRPNSFRQSPCNYDQIIEYVNTFYNTPITFRQTLDRKYKFTYFSMPLEVVLRSKMKNFNRVYAKGGIRTGLRIRSVAKETYSTKNSQDDSWFGEDKILIRDANRWKYNLTAGAGFEHVFTGHASVFIEIAVDLALNNNFSQNQNDANIFYASGTTDYYPVENLKGSSDFGLNHLRQSQVRIKFGMIF